MTKPIHITTPHAEPTGDQVIPSGSIDIQGVPPAFLGPDWMASYRDWYAAEAAKIVSVLRLLPGGTWDALYASMTQEKASLLAVRHDWPETGERKSLFQMVQEIHAALPGPQVVVHSKPEEPPQDAAVLVRALGEIVNTSCSCDYAAPWATALSPHHHKDGCPYKVLCGGDPLAPKEETQS